MVRRNSRNRLAFEELESRILFSADSALLTLNSGAAQAEMLPQYAATVVPAQLSSNQTSGQQQAGMRHEIVFIDGAVDDAQALADKLMAQQDGSRRLTVYVLETDRDGIAQIGAILAGQQELDAVHILSHGGDGELQLGSTRLNDSTLLANAMAVSGWGEALSGKGDILLYGCDVAQTAVGQRFVDTLGQLTGADMEASSNLTGNAMLHGDWTLEYARGQIETAIVADLSTQAGYTGILAVFTVTSTADSGAGTLRQAILDANANAGADIIRFDLPTNAPLSVKPTSQLPDITGQTTIDGTSQAGYIDVPIVTIDGDYAPYFPNGLRFIGAGASGSVVQGVALVNFGRAINIDGASNMVVQGNYIGLDASGAVHRNTEHGLYVVNAANTLIGGSTATARNVISGNQQNGIRVEGSSSGTTIIGNYIGTDITGNTAIGNNWAGVQIESTNTTIGGGTAETRNVISGNVENGILLTGNSSNSTVIGNYIGTNAAGSAALGNMWNGINAQGASITIGGGTAGQGNLISGNGQTGISLDNGGGGMVRTAATGTRVLGNLIGVNFDGTLRIANQGAGIAFNGAANNNTVGGSTAAERNLISGNNGDGISFWIDTFSNTVLGNYIGVDATGMSAIANVGTAVFVRGTLNRIGSATANSGNVISANLGNGITIAGTGNFVQGNYIGVAADGTTALGNGNSGIVIQNDSRYNMIGGTAAGAGNIIANSGGNGISVESNNVTGNSFLGNRIFNSTGLGIDLNPTGVTLNDAGDADTGANNLQNFPVITRTASNGTLTGVLGTFNSTANTTFRLEFFASATVDGSGHGEAQRYLGFVNVTTDAYGNATFQADWSVSSSIGEWVTGTATNLGTNDTSEFGLSVQIVQSDHAPTGTDRTITIDEDQSYLFTIADFGFADPNDTPAHDFLGVLLTTVPASGSLTLNGTAVTAGTLILASDISTGKLRYVPLANANGSGLGTFTFQVRDSATTVGGGFDTDATPRTMTIDVTSVNDAPTGTSKTITIREDADYTLTVADFGFSDPSDFPGDTLKWIFFDVMPTAGTLKYLGAAFPAGFYVSFEDITLGNLVYTPAANAAGIGLDSISFRVTDRGGTDHGGVDTDPFAKVLTFNVMAVNDAPEGTSTTVTAVEDTPYVFAVGDFGYTDPHDTPANAWLGLTLESLPASGILKLDGVAVTAGSHVLRSQIADGKLVYTPFANANGTGVASFTFRVQDDGGTSDGGIDTDLTARTLTIDITAVNDAPSGASNTVTTSEDISYVFSAADFSFSDTDDSSPNAPQAVYVTTIPSSGTLTVDGSAIGVGTLVSWADIVAGKFRYVPVADASGAALGSFTFQVEDDGGTALAGVNRDTTPRSMTIDVTAVNDAPVLAGAGSTVNYTENDTTMVIGAGITVTDVDNTTLDHATVSIVAGFASGQDELNLINDPAMMGNIAASFNAGTGVLLLTSAGATATAAEWQAALRAVSYYNNSDNPSTAARTISYVISDGALASNIVTQTITVAAVNDAPVLAGAGSTISYTENGSALVIGAGITVDDVDTTTLSQATIGITGGFSSGQDVLSLASDPVTMGNIAASFNAGTGVLTLTSTGNTASNAEWQAALRAVSYHNTTDNPSAAARTISYVINDGALDSNVVTQTVTVAAVNDAPVLNSPTLTHAYTENAAPLAIDPAIVISDADNGTLASATVSMTGGFAGSQDELNLINDPATMGNIVANYDGSSGVLTLTSAGNTATVAEWQTALRAVTYRNASDNPSTVNRNVSFAVNDGTASSNVTTQTIIVTAVNDAPVLAGAGATVGYTENAAALAIGAGITVADADNLTLSQATISITAGFMSGQDELSLVHDPAAMGNIAASFDAGTGMLTLTSAGSTATTAEWQAALRAVTYRNSSDNPSTAVRTISYAINDGALDSNVVLLTMTVTAVNDAPVLTSPTLTHGYVENAGPLVIDSALVIADLDNNTLAGATISITGGFASGQDELAFMNNPATMGNIMGSYDGATGVLALSSAGNTANVAQWQAALRAVSYVNNSENPSTTNRTVSFVVNDGASDSNVTTQTVTVTSVNDAPVLGGAGGTVHYTENALALVIAPAISVADVDNTTLNHATVSLDAGFASSQDVLELLNDPATMGNIVASYDAGTGVLTLTSAGSTATAAEWQTALRAVTYRNSSEHPSTANRSVSFVVNDGVADSNVTTQTVTVAPVNDVPVLGGVGATVNYTENDLALVIGAGITVTDVDNTTLSHATVSMSAGFASGQDVLELMNDPATMGNIVASYDAVTGVLTLTSAGSTATVAEWQTALRAVSYRNNSETPSAGNRTVNFTVNDGLADSNMATQTVAVTSVNDAPVLAGAGGSVNYTENELALAIAPGITVADVDNTMLSHATVSMGAGFDNGQDLLVLVNHPATMGNIVGSYDTATGVLTLTSAGNTATVAEWQAALRAVTYTNSSDNPSTLNRTVSFVVNDGLADSNVTTQTVTVTSVNDAPVLGGAGGSMSYMENDTPLAIAPGITVTDADNAALSHATVRMETGFDSSQDVLDLIHDPATMGNIVGSYDSATGVLTLTSAGHTASAAQWEAALRAVSYRNNSEHPSTATRTVSLVVSDGLADSNVAMQTLSVTSVNDAPVLGGAGGTVNYTENDLALAIAPGITVTDADNTTLGHAAVSITGGFTSGQDVLDLVNDPATMGNIVASYDAGTGVLTLTSAGNTATSAEWQAALRAVSYHNSSNNPSTATRTIGYVFSDGALDSNTATQTLTVTAISVAPVLVSPTLSLTWVEKGGALAIDTGIVVSDDDNMTLAGGTVSITGGFVARQDILALAPGLVDIGNIVASYDAASGVLTLASAGSLATVAQWQAALRAVTYSNSSDNPVTAGRTVSYVVDDGALTSNVTTQTISVTAVNDAPVVTVSAGAADYLENGIAVAIDPGLLLGDAENLTLAWATVSISANFVAAQDVLGFANLAGAMGNISATHDAGNGRLTLTSAGATATLAQWQAALRAVTYLNTSDAPAMAVRTISIVVSDGAAASLPAERALVVTAVNDAPAGSDRAVTTLEDTPYRFTADDFGFSDAGDAGAHGLLAVIITTIPASGTLSVNGIVLTAGSIVSRVDIDAGRLLFIPAANSHGSNAAAFTFQVRDDRGTADGGVDTDPLPRSMDISITPVNDAPAGTSTTVLADASLPYVLGLADFGLTDDLDRPGNALLSVTITVLPASGALTLDGAGVPAGTRVLRSDIEAGRLVYRPVSGTDAQSIVSLEFLVQDDGGIAWGGSDTDIQGRTLTIVLTRAAMQGTAPGIAPGMGAGNRYDAQLGLVSESSAAPATAAAVAPAAVAGPAALPAVRAPGQGSAAASPGTKLTAQLPAQLSAQFSEMMELMYHHGTTTPAYVNVDHTQVVRGRFEQTATGAYVALARDSYRNEIWLQAAIERQAMKTLPQAGAGMEVLAPLASPDYAGSDDREFVHMARDTAMDPLETAVAITALTTAWVAARKAALVASLFSGLPAWFRLDPLPVLARSEEDEAGPDAGRDGAGRDDREDRDDRDDHEHNEVEENAAQPGQDSGAEVPDYPELGDQLENMFGAPGGVSDNSDEMKRP